MIKTAASLEAEQKRARAEREAAGTVVLQQMSEESEQRRPEEGRRGGVRTHYDCGRWQGAEAASKDPSGPSKLRLVNPVGEILAGTNTKTSAKPMDPTKNDKPLRDADKSRPKEKRPSGSAPRNYTQEEQESLGAEICRWVLGLDESEIVNIRNQHNVGADAVNQLNNFYEYKVHAGAIPDVIRLEPSQIERARTTPNFFLVVIGNLQAGAGDPEVRIITSPLDQLALQPTTSVQFVGVLAAKALAYRFTLQDGSHEG